MVGHGVQARAGTTLIARPRSHELMVAMYVNQLLLDPVSVSF